MRQRGDTGLRRLPIDAAPPTPVFAIHRAPLSAGGAVEAVVAAVRSGFTAPPGEGA